jgi:hypothetical protein
MSDKIIEILDSLPVPDRILAAEKLGKLEWLLKRDLTMADSLVRILKSPIGKELRETIKEIANNGL